ncbi:hypothetical protein L1987_51117 [Smallanthus sonchifolius]|uniref:Uncharacterized protein n=1 Tax=Smallanthus sonchifolius TaxID=185202 RepID=A0ACB9ENS5_9ASTR|nr:hypothetical protein L1987_51117 [Smallanthus sonchifolius]
MLVWYRSTNEHGEIVKTVRKESDVDGPLCLFSRLTFCNFNQQQGASFMHAWQQPAVGIFEKFKSDNSAGAAREHVPFDIKNQPELNYVLHPQKEKMGDLTRFSRDLKQLLASDQSQIPNSLKQVSRIAVSDEFSKSLTCVSEAATLGVIQGYNEEQFEEQKAKNSSFKDRVIDKLMSESGTGFVSVVVGSFARNLVMGFDSNGMYESRLKLSTDLGELVDVLSTNKSKLVMGDLIKTFVSTAVDVYLDRPTGVNLYDGVFSGMADPKREKHVKDIAVYVCSGAVETLIKTSHQVLTS